MHKIKFHWLLGMACLCLLNGMAVTAQPSPPQPPPIPARAAYFNPLEAQPWESFSGQLPKAATNLNVAPSWDYEGTALSVATNVPAFLQLDVFQNGRTNISLESGSLEIWCQANWTSMADGGTGPQAWATIWDIGSFTPDASIGAWLLTIDPSGSNLVWLAQSDGSDQMLWTPIDFDAGDWHQVVATWSASNSVLYVDGVPTTNAGPILYGPSTLECSNDGFCVGSLCTSGTNAGTNQFQGQLQWLVSYAQPLTDDEVSNNFAEMGDYIAYFGYSVPGEGGFHSDLSGPPGLPGDGGSGTNDSEPSPISPGYISQAPSEPVFYPTFDAVAGPGYLVALSTNSSGCISSTNVWITNATAATTNGGVNLSFEIAGGTNGLPYDIFATPALAKPLTNAIWSWMGQAYQCVTYTIPGLTNSDVFLLLGTPQDSYGNGLTDAYELLVLHNNPANTNSGDGMLDGWKVLWGMNPLVNNSAQASERANYVYDGTGRLESFSGITAEAFTFDAEGNVQQDSP